MGDYGHFTDSKEFCREGNLFADLEPLSMADIRKHKLSFQSSTVSHWPDFNRRVNLHDSLILLLPSNDNFRSLLTSLSTRLTNRCLVTRIIQCLPYPHQPGSNFTTSLYSVAKPFVWHRNESARSGSDERSGDELRGETKGDQVKVSDIDGRMLWSAVFFVCCSLAICSSNLTIYSFVYHF